LIGGAVTTLWTWRLVFVGEVVIVAAIVLLTRRIKDVEPEGAGHRIDVVGVVLSAAGLGLAVYGVLRSSEWGWVLAKESAPSLWGLSLTLVLIVAGALVTWIFFWWEERVIAAGKEPLVQTSLLRNAQLAGGMTMFFFQFMIQAGLFFAVPLYLSVALGLSAFETGVRLMPLSITLLLAAVGIPKIWPQASPRSVVRWGLAALLAGVASLILALEAGAGPEIVTVPMLLAGLGVGALASQLGAVTVSSVGDELTGEVGGLQNTATNLGASLGTALVGSVLVTALSASFFAGIEDNPDVPDETVTAGETALVSGVPFLSDEQLESALREAGLPEDQVQAIREENEVARIDGLRLSLSVLVLLALLALYLTRLLPVAAVGADPPGGQRRESTSET
jgi:hypothetical protein